LTEAQIEREEKEKNKPNMTVVQPEGAMGERSETMDTGGRTTVAPRPGVEVPEKAKRRTFTAEYKQRILREVDACTKPGEIGALLRREGLYSSHLTKWRRQRAQGEAEALSPKRRGPGKGQKTVSVKEHESLKREARALRHKLEKAELIIDIQKKVSKMLGITLKSPEDDGSE